MSRYPTDLEATVYFCVLEALQNVQKHAGATRVVVRLTESEGELRFEVEDDGRGFEVEDGRRGSGLTNLADRLDAVGGRLEVDAAPGRGSRLSGIVPLRLH